MKVSNSPTLAPRSLYRMVALDIDGTLLGPDGTIGTANRQAVERLKEAGVEVVLASGRSHGNMMEFHESLGLSSPVVSVHGALVRDPLGVELWSHGALDETLVREVTLAGRQAGVAVLHYRSDGVFLDTESERTAFDQSRNREPQQLVEDLLALPGHTHKVMWLAEPEVLAGWAKTATTSVPHWESKLHRLFTDPGYLEFMPTGVSKAAGVGVVARGLGLEADQVAAFGDGNNDAPMLAWAGMGVAMPHGSEAARAAARQVGPEGSADEALARALAVVFPSLVRLS